MQTTEVGLVMDTTRPCPTGTVVGLVEHGVLLIPSRCRRWACPDCGWRNARVLAERIVATHAQRFITLTLRQDETAGPVEQLDRMNRAFRSLWKRIKRKTHGRALGYVKVVELTQKGTPHFHVAVTSPFLSQRWLAAQWAALTGSFVVDIRVIHSARGLSRYLAKYLTKASETVSARRKFSASRSFLPPAEAAHREPEDVTPVWKWNNRPQSELESALTEQGYTPIGKWWLAPLAASLGPP